MIPTDSGVDAPTTGERSAETDDEMPGVLPAGGLRASALRGSAWTLVAFALAQAFRLGSNLILTRLLFPEIFGLMALANVFLYGLHMLSDVGIANSVIQNRRGDELRFLQTAWTVQVVRGLGLSLTAAAIAWPVSHFYQEPQLLTLLPVIGLTAGISGFHSIALVALRRRMQIGRITALDLMTQVLGILTTIAAAWRWRSVWALVLGAIASEMFRLVLSHRLLPEIGARFVWDREVVAEIRSFGKWIFMSSALFFLASQADRLYLGRFAGISAVGIYSIAVLLSESMLNLITSLSHGVLYPALSQVARADTERLRSAYYRARLLLDAISLPSLGFLATAGVLVVRLLYDPRYIEAGWILEMLAVRVAMASITTPCETCLFAIGQTRYGFYRSLGRAIWVVGGLPLGWMLGGLHGLVWAAATSEIPVLAVLWPAFRREGLLSLPREALAAGLFAGGALIGLTISKLALP